MIRDFLFSSQMDYIFFFYGASFVVLGAVCFSILRRSGESKTLPWWWLGLFGFVHGLNEWMDMVALSLSILTNNFAFTAIRYSVLMASFVCLMEFARRGSYDVWKKRIRPEFYIVLLIVALLGLGHGWAGLNAMSRYAFGFVSSIWSALVFLYYNGIPEKPLSRGTRALLRIAGIAMFFYGLLTGLFVSNLKVFHISVQFLRGLCAFILATSIAIYAIKHSLMAFFKEEVFKEKRFMAYAITAVVLILGLFWLGFEAVDLYSRKVEQDEKYTRQLKAKMFVQFVNMTITRLQPIQALAANPKIIEAFTAPHLTDEYLKDMNERLDRYRLAMKADVCYFMDKSGLTVVSTNRDTPKSFVGKNYAFRLYFQEAMKGSPTVYLAKGVTSMERGMYISYPISGPQREGILPVYGVTVAKDNLTQLEKAFRTYPYVFLVSPEGIIFVSSKAEFIFKSIGDISSEEQKWIRNAKQFGEGPWENAGFHHRDDQAGKILLKNKPYYFASEKIDDLVGWKIFFMEDSTKVANARFILILIFLSLFLLVISIALFIFRIYLDKLHISASEALYEALVEGSPDSVKLFNRAGRCISINKTGLEMMGWKKEDVLGKRFEELWPQEYKQKVREAISGVLEGRQQSFEARMVRSDGASVIKTVILAPIFEANGTIKYFIGIARDITEERRARERLLQSSKMATVGALATGVAHEFNNVLEIIIGNAELAYASQDPESMKNTMKTIIDSTKRAGRIVKMMLDFSGKPSEAKELLDLKELIHQNLTLLMRIFETSHMVVETYFEDIPKIYGNSAQLSQVFFNIMLNARDAMRSSSEKKLTISLDYDSHAHEVVICFQDTGIGIKEELKDKIFGPFVTTKGILGGGEDREPGVGLGLYVAYGIIKQHGGMITVESEEGKGTKFCISLPESTKLATVSLG